MKERRRSERFRNRLFAVLTAILIFAGISILWVASLRIPALEDLAERKVNQSTKIYDRTGEILLYDMARDVRRAQIGFDQISPNIKQATIAIEDKHFYSHHGIEFKGLFRALLTDLKTLSFSQGGSTLTQQVVKNSILTKDKTPTRKLKELILAIKLEHVLSKDEIITLYLNEISYGGTVYGVEEASRNFFGKSASDVDLAEAAYLAAIPKAPSYYSPFGSHFADLEARKNQVLKEMLDQGYITGDQYQQAKAEKVSFKPKENTGAIKAPHFVFFVIDYLAKKYGEDALQNSGFKVVTTLDYDIQKNAESIAKKYGEINTEKFNGTNNGIVVIDPKTGDILAMVGSRDYFDKAIDGNFNITTSHRQPGSTFKPFVYATLFNKGYTDKTVLWDVPIQFSTKCAADNFTTDDTCYAPGNYDDKFRGPMTIRNALAQSINLPAVQAIYLASVRDSIETAKAMGIDSLSDTSRFGLSLVLGGGEVSLLDLTSAYSVFANDGVRNPYNPVLWIEDPKGNVIDKYSPFPRRVVNEQPVRIINDILSDNVARTPGYGPNSALYIQDRPVAVKTGTSNDYRDAWIVGYAPNVVVGAWVGNNDNTPMEKKTAGLIVSPMWRELMDEILPKLPSESFVAPEEEDPENLKPILKGDWQTGGIHSILYWVYKDNPRGPIPTNPNNDPEFSHWEYSVTHFGYNYSANPGSTISTTTPATQNPATDPNNPYTNPAVPLPPIPNF